jgi:TP901 family phage tail tape measure protein
VAGAGYRTFYMTIRMRDEATRGARSVNSAIESMGKEAESASDKMASAGEALMGVGTNMLAIAGIGAGVLANMTKEALEFSQGMAYAFTQVDEAGVSLAELKDIARNVSREIPVPLEQVAEGLYDLFSSVDITMDESEDAMKLFSKASIAGMTDIRTATRSTVAVMNAYEMGSEDINEILDWQFQLVRKGIGTYDDFAGVIGLSLPAFRAADQELDTLGGTLTFLTRNGLSASRASTSAARAMELLATPKATQNLRDLGIEVTNADGTFRQINDIVTDLAAGPMKDLQGPEFREAFKEIFGTGRIQARRFFDVALKNTAEYNQRIDEMTGKMGAMETAYDIMYNEPLMRSQELKVAFSLLKEEVGQRLIPAFERLVDWGMELIDKWNELDEETKDQIITWASWTVGILAAAGVAFIFAGGILLLTSVFSSFVALLKGFSIVAIIGRMVGFFAAMGPVGWIVAAVLVVLAGLAYLIYRNWDTLVSFWNQTLWPALVATGNFFKDLGLAIADFAVVAWGYIVDFGVGVWNFLKEWGPKIWGWMKAVWDKAFSITKTVWGAVAGFAIAVWEEVGPRLAKLWEIIVDNATAAWGMLSEAGVDLWHSIVGIWHTIFPILKAVWEEIWMLASYIFPLIWEIVVTTFQYIWDQVQVIWPMVWDTITAIAESGWSVLKAVWDVMKMAWENFWPAIKEIAITAWDATWTILGAAIEIGMSVINAIIAIFTGDWEQLWEEVKDIATSLWDIIATAFGYLWTIIEEVWGAGIGFLTGLPETIVGLVGDGLGVLVGWGGDMMSGLGEFLLNAVKAGGTLALKLIELVAGIVGWFIDVGADIGGSIVDGIYGVLSTIFVTLQGWWDGMITWFENLADTIWDAVWNGLKGLGSAILDSIMDTLGPLGDFVVDVNSNVNSVLDFINPFAHGGVINGPQVGLMGEAGAEAVIPLSRPGDAYDVMQAAGLGGEGPNITVNVYGGDNSDGFANKVAKAIGEEMYANGY